MSVIVTLIGRLGNNLFQYALGRIIAEHHGFELECQLFGQSAPGSVWQSKIIANSTLPGLREYFPCAMLSIKGAHADSPVEPFELGGKNGWSGHRIDLQSVLRNRELRRIRLTGYFQRMEYFLESHEQIRKWFQVRIDSEVPAIHDNDVILNIRRGSDYARRGWILPLRYYEIAMSRLERVARVYVCGVGVDTEILDRLRRYDVIPFTGPPIKQFAFMSRFRRMILSNSTFAWWAAYLSDAEEIYAPHSPSNDFYAFTGYSDVDLHMREPRYVMVGDWYRNGISET